MKLSSKAIENFKKIYFKMYGVHLNDNEANTRGVELLQFFKLVYKPIPGKDYERLHKNS